METSELRPATDFAFNRYLVDLTTKTVRFERMACDDLEDTATRPSRPRAQERRV